jgi:hypothetical protein
MKELNEYREKLINRLTEAAKEFREACLAVKDPYTPIEVGGWNAHQVAAHTRDTDELVYGLRVRRTLAEDNPEFLNFDGEAYMAKHYNPKPSISELLDGFVSNVVSLAETLRGLPAKAWTRTSQHETQGDGLTLQTWVERGLAHIEEHLEMVKKTK